MSAPCFDLGWNVLLIGWVGNDRDGDTVCIRVSEDGKKLHIRDNHPPDPTAGTGSEIPVNPEDHS